MVGKKIARIQVINGGSPPDVDSDFNTSVRDLAVQHVAELHGEKNVAGLTTFQSLAAKGTIKKLCTIYRIPFALANKVSALIPDGEEGEEVTISDLFDPTSKYYRAGEGFRMEVSGAQWTDIITSAKSMNGRYSAVGRHPCGYIISSQPIHDHAPTRFDANKGNTITQWKYEDCEKMGFIKFDFLSLDCVDIVQHTIESIIKGGGKAPNMVDLIHGPMDDPKTYELFQRGDTIGVFQFGSNIVREFCRKMQPKRFEDLAATTALMRPGPMGMQTHTRYAARNNGSEEKGSIHPEFVGSPLDEILEPTNNLIVYQESILRIANEIAGLTLQEGDNLRKAMGKKNKVLMESKKVDFMAGGNRNGYSDEAMEALWETLAKFAEYGFNLSHSVAYAMNAYSTAYLKTHYPADFMAASLTQFSEKRDKVLELLREARSMGLKIGTVDINRSQVRVFPDHAGNSGYDIIYGLGNLSGVSNFNAGKIVQEREDNGPYTSVQDLVNRCVPLGVSNKKIYESLALGGAFDALPGTRRGIVENLNAIMNEAKTKSSKGSNLFDMFATSNESNDSSVVDLDAIEEYPFVLRQQHEAAAVGLYLSDHPLSRMGNGLSNTGAVSIEKLLQSTRSSKAVVVGCLTTVDVKTRGGHKRISVSIDDGTDYLAAGVDRSIVKGIEVHQAREKVEKMYCEGETKVSKEIADWATNEEFSPIAPLEKNAVYIMGVTFRPGMGDNAPSARVDWVRPLVLAHDGSLPVRVRVVAKQGEEESYIQRMNNYADKVAKAHPGEFPLMASVMQIDQLVDVNTLSGYYADLVKNMASAPTQEVKKKRVSAKSNASEGSLFGGAVAPEEAPKEEVFRTLPPKASKGSKRIPENVLADIVDYYDTGVRISKSAVVEELLSKRFGGERIDFGVFNAGMMED